MDNRTNWREPWPWHLTAWSVLILGLLLRDEDLVRTRRR